MLPGLAPFQKHRLFCLVTSPVYTQTSSFYGCDDWDCIICLVSTTPLFILQVETGLERRPPGRVGRPLLLTGLRVTSHHRHTHTRASLFWQSTKLHTIASVPSSDIDEGTHTCRGDGKLISLSVEPQIRPTRPCLPPHTPPPQPTHAHVNAAETDTSHIWLGPTFILARRSVRHR